MKAIETRISKFEARIIEHYRRLDQESIWLFIAVVGCWSITVNWLQILALLLVFYFLLRNIFDGLELKSSHKQELNEISEEIKQASIEEEAKEKYYGKLWKIEKNNLTLSTTIKKNIKFLASLTFAAISSAYFFDNLIKNIYSS